MTAYFGTGWPAGIPILEDATLLDPPKPGTLCLQCNEPFGPDDRGFYIPYLGDDLGPEYVTPPGLVADHYECQLMSVVGHMVGVCSCTGYTRTRANAQEALRRWEAR